MDSSLGTRAQHLEAAVEALGGLPGTRVLGVSRAYRTAAVAPSGVEAAGQPEYLNAAVVVETGLGPRELLRALLEIERARGRDRAAEGRWGPRTLDLDLLLYGEQVIDEPGLTVPHPRMTERAFVLVPLAEVAGDWRVPGRGRGVRVAEWLGRLPAGAVDGVRGLTA